MSISTLRIIVAIILISHGIGHVLGILVGFKIKLTPTHSISSWLLTKIIGESISHILGVILFLAALALFVAAGFGLIDWLVPQHLWEKLAIIASIISLVALALFPKGFPTLFPNVIGAVAVDIAIIVLSVWQRWPSDFSGG